MEEVRRRRMVREREREMARGRETTAEEGPGIYTYI